MDSWYGLQMLAAKTSSLWIVVVIAVSSGEQHRTFEAVCSSRDYSDTFCANNHASCLAVQSGNDGNVDDKMLEMKCDLVTQ